MKLKYAKNQLISRQQASEFGLSVRFLEECHRKTKLTGELVGPIFFRIENTVKYKVQHLEEYMEKCEVNADTAQYLEKKCEHSKKICKKYSVAKKYKYSPQIPQVTNKNIERVEIKKKRIN